MRILGLETSCDETAAAVVDDGHVIRASVVSSQVAQHARYGGVIPELAAREHLQALPVVVAAALRQAPTTVADLDAVAVTQGPGLMPALVVGLAYAKGLAAAAGRPLVGVNHFVAHIFGAFLAAPDRLRAPATYPVLALVVSGGHTALVLIAADGACRLVGQTLDDAAGEAFDKAAKILELPYPGGPVIDRLARQGDPARHRFPRGLCGGPGQPVKAANRLNFSFSGVKTALLYHVRGPGAQAPPRPLPAAELADIAASYQEAVVDALVTKTLWAAAATGARTVVAAGGVACNSRLRAKLTAAVTLPLLIAPPNLCTDNAVMVAGLAHYCLRAGQTTAFDADAYCRLGDLAGVPFGAI